MFGMGRSFAEDFNYNFIMTQASISDGHLKRVNSGEILFQYLIW